MVGGMLQTQNALSACKLPHKSGPVGVLRVLSIFHKVHSSKKFKERLSERTNSLPTAAKADPPQSQTPMGAQ
jgi:hypothetical protein